MNDLISMMKQVKTLKNGLGIQNLLDAACIILGNPMFMFDTDYKLLSYTETVTDDSIWNEMIAYGTFRRETQEFFKDEGFVEVVANAKRITFMTSDKLKYNRILGKIFNKNNTHVANLVIIACNKPFEPQDSAVFEAICKIITKEISNSEFYQQYEKIYQETLVRNLIDGIFEDRELYAAHIATIYDSLKENLYLAVADTSKCDPDHTKLVYFRDLFKQIQAEYKYAIYSDYILIIISTDHSTLNVNKELNKLNKLFEQNNIYVGISSSFENLFELSKYYTEALKALNYIGDSKSNQRIFPHDITSIDTMEQIRALKNGMGVQYLLNEAVNILGNPVLLHDNDSKFWACTENIEIEDPIWEEFVTYGTVSDETFELFRMEGWVDAVASSKTGVLLVSNQMLYDRINARIYNKDDIMIGCLIIVACNNPFEKDALALFDAFCQKFSQEVSITGFYNNYGQEHTETLISKLISGNIDNSYNLIWEDIANTFDSLTDNLHVAVIDATQCSPEYNQFDVRALFKKLQFSYKYAIHSPYFVIIISLDNIPLDTKLSEMNELFKESNIYAGISSRFGTIYELQKYYTEAFNALNDGLKNKDIHKHQRVFISQP